MKKHNKKKNTAFLFEVCIRSLTDAVQSKNDLLKNKILKIVKESLSKYLKADKDSYKKIYISREDVNKMWSSLAPSRSYPQEQTLIDYFISQGYNKVVLTDYGYIDQINILLNATHVAGLTGSGLFNTFFLLFCKYFPIVSLSEIKLIMPKPLSGHGKGGH